MKTLTKLKLGGVALLGLLMCAFIFVPALREWAVAGLLSTIGVGTSVAVNTARKSQNTTLTDLEEDTAAGVDLVSELEEERDADLAIEPGPAPVVTYDPDASAETVWERERRLAEMEAETWGSGRW